MLLLVTAASACVAAAPDSAAAFFIRPQVSPQRVYAGQTIVIRYLLYYRTALIDPENELEVTFPNCLVEAYPRSEVETTERWQGATYRVRQLGKYAVTPQVAGPLPLPVVTLRYKISAPPDPEDFFGEPRILTRTLRSPAQTLPVLALPPVPDSIPFARAVGQFQFEPRFGPAVSDGRRLALQLKIRGTGSLQLFALPAPALPAHVELFGGAEQRGQRLTEAGLRAEYTYTGELYAKYRGTYTVAGLRIGYFDPAAGQYRLYVAPAYTWRVTSGPPAPAPARVSAKRRAAQPRLFVQASLYQAHDYYRFYGSGRFYLLLGLTGLLLGLGAGLHYYRQLPPHTLPGRGKVARYRALWALRRVAARPDVSAAEARCLAADEILITYLCRKLAWPRSAFTLIDFATHPAVQALPAPVRAQTLHELQRHYKLRFAGAGAEQCAWPQQQTKLAGLIHQLDTYLHDQAPDQRLATAR
ncbi:hypothetical protein LJ737_15150 [Hymenobacter sp. 15J16-1T3B]|uniref:hypothetical protein n=1 Tax=Hymenobacter sp. 15J16-1T3B TaxID=2886941 RepID=UPI001D10F753|nr:hypothetical protein [Hymenobacter sp. 15J16-1T3B]MCC3158585.1 hypothetical protein [Hymenobacter sp. 15J16-1T3B]